MNDFSDNSKRYLNLKEFISELEWASGTDSVIKESLKYLSKVIKEAEIEFILWDEKKKSFFLYKLDGYKCLKSQYNLKDKTLYEKAFSLKENIIKSLNEERVLVIVPIFFKTTSYGLVSVSFENKSFYSPSILEFLEIVTSIIGFACSNYFYSTNLKNEIDKKISIYEELKKNYLDKKNLEDIVSSLDKQSVDKYVLKSIIHKINNKMSPVLGYSQLLQTQLDGKKKDRISKILLNTEKAVEALNNLTEFISKGEHEKQKVKLNRLIKDIIEEFKQELIDNQIKVTLDLEEEIPVMIIDKNKLRKAVKNLLVNSIEALENNKNKNKEIKIISEYKKNNFHIIIIDNGKGISKEHLEKLFEPFFTIKEDKTGLGLNFVHGFANSNQGGIDVEVRKDKKTQFHLFFYADVLKKVEWEDETREYFSNKILVFNKDEKLLDLISNILSYEGYSNIELVDTMKNLIKKLNDNKYSLIVMDFEISTNDKNELLKRLKKIKDGRKIIITSNVYSEEIMDLVNNKNIDFIKKPFSIIEFSDIITKKIKKLS